MKENETGWREIPGWSGFFASPDQQIKRADYITNSQNRKARLLTQSFYHRRPKSTAKSNGPYIRVTRDNKSRYVPLADLMAAAFVRQDYDPKLHKILFKDHDQNNCSPSNLMVVERH